MQDVKETKFEEQAQITSNVQTDQVPVGIYAGQNHSEID